MVLDAVRSFVSRRPAWIIDDLARRGGRDRLFFAESDQARGGGSGVDAVRRTPKVARGALMDQCWPDQAYDAMAVAVLHRPAVSPRRTGGMR